MRFWINYEAPGFTGEHYYRVWWEKPTQHRGNSWYDVHGNQTSSYRVQCEFLERLFKEQPPNGLFQAEITGKILARLEG